MLWGEILDDLRVDLQDEAGTKFDEDRLFLYMKWAVRDYSQWNPRLLSTMVAVNASGVAALPDDCIRPVEVRDASTGDLIKEARSAYNPPDVVPYASRIRWWREGNNIRFNTWTNSPSDIDLLYFALHVTPESASATGTEMTFPDADEEAILLYIRAKEMGSTRQKTAMLDRYKRRTDAGNTRTDNPLRPEEHDLMGDYIAYMSERYGAKSRKLRRRR